MSAKGLIAGVVGAVAGFIVGGPAGAVIGFGLGMGIGMMMDPLEPDAPDTPGQGQIQKMDIPTADYGDPLPDFIGTVKIAGNIIHSWGHRVVEITEQQSTPGGKAGGGEQTQTVVVGYEHHLSWLHAFSYGPDPVDTLWTVLFDEKPVWFGELTDDDGDGEETVQLGDASGENLGSMTFYFGTSNQTPNAKAGAQLDNPSIHTAYRGLCYAMFDDVMIGSYARSPSIKIIVSKFPPLPVLGSETLSIVKNFDYNGAFAIWYIATKHANFPETFLNAQSFSDTAYYTAKTDFPPVGVSMFLNRQIISETYIDGVMSHLGLTLVEKDGELHLGVLRNNVLEVTMETIDDKMVLEIPSLTVGSWEDTYNDLKILYSKINDLEQQYIYDCGNLDYATIDTKQFTVAISAGNQDKIHLFNNIYLTSISELGNTRRFEVWEIDPDGNITSLNVHDHTFSYTPTTPTANTILWSESGTSSIVVTVGHTFTDVYYSTFRILSDGTVTHLDTKGFPGGATNLNDQLLQVYPTLLAQVAGGQIQTIGISTSGTIDSDLKDTYTIPSASGSRIFKLESAAAGVVIVGYDDGTEVVLRSFSIGTGGNIIYLDEHHTGITEYPRFFSIEGRPHVTWQGTYQGIVLQWERYVYPEYYIKARTIRCNGGYFLPGYDDEITITTLPPGAPASRHSCISIGGKGIVSQVQMNQSAGSPYNYIFTFNVERFGTIDGVTDSWLTKANIGGTVENGKPLRVNASDGIFVLDYYVNLQTFHMTDDCGET